jgi:acylpyruvate hydrolase
VKLATIRHQGSNRAVRIDDAHATDLGTDSLLELLREPNWRRQVQDASGAGYPVDSLDYAPLIPGPEKILCVGLNYRTHILEMGREPPEFPTLFAKYARALVGATDVVNLPVESSAVDWEAELGVIVGAPVRRASVLQAEESIAGYTVINDVTCRDWQSRTAQWLQGKSFEGTTPVGPWLVTADEVSPDDLELVCEVNGEVVQAARTSDLVFSPAEIVSYISQFITLVPGDVIATGTPGGVGHARSPKRYLQAGDTLVTRIERLGECRNRCQTEG